MLTSLRNPRVKDVVRLRNRRHRNRQRRFVIEGHRQLAHAAEAGFPVQTIFYCEELFAGRGEGDLVWHFAAAGAEREPATRPVFEKMAYQRHPEGVLGVAEMPSPTLDELPDFEADRHDEPALWLVAAAIEKPGNLGALLRCADAVGASGVLVADPATDPFNPNVVRASAGTLFSVPLAVATAAAVREWLDERGIRVIAASPAAEMDYAAADFRAAAAVVVGSEHRGLDAQWRTGRCQAVRIPMAGRADSLNAAMAATVLLFEARRQRSAAEPA